MVWVSFSSPDMECLDQYGMLVCAGIPNMGLKPDALQTVFGASPFTSSTGFLRVVCGCQLGTLRAIVKSVVGRMGQTLEGHHGGQL